jgi:hypothetical protein
LPSLMLVISSASPQFLVDFHSLSPLVCCAISEQDTPVKSGGFSQFRKSFLAASLEVFSRYVQDQMSWWGAGVFAEIPSHIVGDCDSRELHFEYLFILQEEAAMDRLARLSTRRSLAAIRSALLPRSEGMISEGHRQQSSLRGQRLQRRFGVHSYFVEFNFSVVPEEGV